MAPVPLWENSGKSLVEEKAVLEYLCVAVAYLSVTVFSLAGGLCV